MNLFRFHRAFRFLRARSFLTLALGSVLAFSLPRLARATTVFAPDFDSLVRQADYVVRGTVKSVTSEWRESGGQRAIFTKVEIDVAETIAGTPPSPLILDVLGGRMGDEEMTVQGAPKFKVGDEAIFFVRGNGVQFHPLVALRHGLYPIKKDADGTPHMMRSDGSPLRDEKEVSQPLRAARTAATETASASSEPATTSPAAEPAQAPLTPDEFARRIRQSRQKNATAP